MKHIFKFIDYLKESNEEDIDITSSSEPVQEKDYTDLKEEIVDMIKSSLKSDDEKLFNDFVTATIKDPDNSQIEGLINDSDIYEFYLKWRNEIDEVLSDINFYDDIPSEIKVYSLYDYIIKGTNKAISEVISKL
jgi:hypothetical protein